MDTEQTFWNGEPANCARGSGIVNGERVRVVRVFYNGEHFDLDDSDDSGWNKVAYGHGSPRYRHKSVTVEPMTFQPDSWAPLIREHFKRECLDPDVSLAAMGEGIVDGAR